MKKNNLKIVVLVISIFALLAVHVFLKGEDVAYAIGGMIWEVTVGLIAGGLVLLNILLFFYNIIRPDNKFKFDVWDKLIAGIWLVIVLKIFNLF